MLEFQFSSSEWFDDATEQFFYSEDCSVVLEHSLLSLSKWESKWKKPLLSEIDARRMTPTMLADYFLCMETTGCPERNWPRLLTEVQIKQIVQYMNDEQTATTFTNLRPDRTFHRQVITSELIYYWMASLNIPFSCETWHLSRLLTLIRVASIQGKTGKKMPDRDVRKMYAEINDQRRKKTGSRG